MGARYWAAVLGLPVLLAAAPAWGRFTPPPSKPQPLWEAGVAGGVASVAKYAGSSERHLYFAGFPYLIYRGPWLRITGRSAHLMLVEAPRYWLDLSGGGWLPVNAGNDAARLGMPDLDVTLQAGPRINYLAASTARSDTVLRLAVRAVWSAAAPNDISHRGYIMEPAVRVAIRPLGRKGRLSVGATLSALLGDSEHNAYFYDVSPRFATPDRPAYKSGAGLVSYALGLSAGWKLTENLQFGVSAQVRTLVGTVVGDSPLVEDDRSYTVGAGLNWIFWKSERTMVLPAPAEE